jgi:isopentenyl-diphosphate delta-isomerase
MPHEPLSLPAVLLMMNLMKDFVVVVNKRGKRTGVAEKMEAHQRGMLHRAFSVLLFNEKGEMLLQKRASGKYHFAGLWSNACCSHPRPGEKVLSAAGRRLREELGIECSLRKSGQIIYRFHDKQTALTEHEFDYVFTGRYEGTIDFNPEEVSAIRWVSLPELKHEMKTKAETFTPWFLEIMRTLNYNLAR